MHKVKSGSLSRVVTVSQEGQSAQVGGTWYIPWAVDDVLNFAPGDIQIRISPYPSAETASDDNNGVDIGEVLGGSSNLDVNMSASAVSELVTALNEWKRAGYHYLYVFAVNASTMDQAVPTQNGGTTSYNNETFMLCEVCPEAIGTWDEFVENIKEIATGSDYDMNSDAVENMLYDVHYVFRGKLRIGSSDDTVSVWAGVQFGEYEGTPQAEMLTPLIFPTWTDRPSSAPEDYEYYTTLSILKAIPAKFMGPDEYTNPYNILSGLQVGVATDEGSNFMVIDLTSYLQCNINNGETIVSLGKYKALGETNEWDFETNVGAKGYDGVTIPMNNAVENGQVDINVTGNFNDIIPITFQIDTSIILSESIDIQLIS